MRMLLAWTMLPALAQAPMPAAAAAPPSPRLAVIIAAPWDGEPSRSNDAVASTAALVRRGFAPRDIVVLQGALSPQGVMAFLQAVSDRIASWTRGEVLLVVSAHGTFTGTTVTNARSRPAIVQKPEPADSSWVGLMDAVANDDLRGGRITSLHVPSRQVVGNAAVPVPGVLPAAGGAPTAVWFVLSREDGCVPLDVLARGDRLPRVPISPDDYADLMRARGHQVIVGPPPGFPPELTGKLVMVTVRTDRAPIFVPSDLCRAGGR